MSEEKETGKATERGRRRAPDKPAAILSALGFMVLLVSVASHPDTGYAAFPGTNGKIAFTSTRDGNAQIYVMNPDGTGQTRLSNNSFNDSVPAWSPDGAKIAFVSTRDGNQEVYVMNADGSGQTNLTQNAASDTAPAWSPDGTKIVFQSNRGNADPNDTDVYVMNADGTNQTPIAANHPTREEQPAWSPVGTKIVYVHSTFFADHQLFTMNPDGTGQALLPPNILPINATAPKWSPNAQKIAFSGTIPGIQVQVYVINADGTGGLTQLTTPADFNGFSPAFAPDGSKIVFSSTRDGNAEIYVMNADGTGQTRLTNNSADDSAPDWQPLPPCTNISCPANIMVNASPGQCGAIVNYPKPTTSGGCSVTCLPSSGSFFPVGTTTVTCTATGGGSTVTCSFTVTVKDTEPPKITGASVDKPVLWPPNHKLVVVTVNYNVKDNCDSPPAINCTLSVTSNEPIKGPGSGNTSPDFVIIDAHHVQLRAERAGTGKGRIYTIKITCTDSKGNSSSQTVTVTVPHDQRA